MYNYFCIYDVCGLFVVCLFCGFFVVCVVGDVWNRREEEDGGEEEVDSFSSCLMHACKQLERPYLSSSSKSGTLKNRNINVLTSFTLAACISMALSRMSPYKQPGSPLVQQSTEFFIPK